MLLIHEIVFSEGGGLKTKRHNHHTKSYVVGFQRKERQVAIGINIEYT